MFKEVDDIDETLAKRGAGGLACVSGKICAHVHRWIIYHGIARILAGVARL